MAEHEVHITIDNSNNPTTLTIVDSKASHGSYNPQPPAVIPAGKVVDFALIANAGLYGAEGSCIFATSDGGQILLTYGDPITADNYATVDTSGTSLRVTWEGKSGSGNWAPGAMPAHGNPVYLQVFVVGS